MTNQGKNERGKQERDSQKHLTKLNLGGHKEVKASILVANLNAYINFWIYGPLPLKKTRGREKPKWMVAHSKRLEVRKNLSGWWKIGNKRHEMGLGLPSLIYRTITHFPF